MKTQRNYFIIAFCCLAAMLRSQSSPCVDDGFEALSTGTLNSAAWLGYTGSGPGIGLCSSSQTVYSSSGAQALVITTPATDALCNNVPNSPFPGNKVLQINKGITAYKTKVTKTFSVTTSNYIYRYAYKGVLDMAHTFCDGTAIVFSFYDCSNTLLTSLSKTLSNISNPDAAFWGTVSPGVNSTPNWVIHQVNLASYIGSCIRLEVLATQCSFTGHQGYLYYDSECSDKFIAVNNTLASSSSYTSCATSATLSGLSGFSNYSWQGPANSGVSGSTLSAVVTTVSGMYTLTASSGTNSFTQVLNVYVNSLTPNSIGNSVTSTLCSGNSATLQLLGPVTSFSWSGGTSTTSIVNPTTTTIYTAEVVNPNGCVQNLSTTINVAPIPPFQILSSNPNVCYGFNTILTAAANATGVVWNNAATSFTLNVTPTVTSIYSATVTSAAGCTNSSTYTLAINPVPQFQLIASQSTLCAGQSVSLSVINNSGPSSYLWSNGAGTQNTVVNPSVTSVYSVQVTNSVNCHLVKSHTISVIAPINLQVSASQNSICPGQSVTLSASGQGIVTYSWSNGSTNPSISVSPTISQVFYANVSNAAGCSVSAGTTITTLPLPQVQITASQASICAGQTITFGATGSGISTYSWSNGSTAPNITASPLVGQTYSVVVAGATGCTTSATGSVSVLPLPQASISSVSGNTICVGQSTKLYLSSGSSIVSSVWSTGANSPSIIASPSATSVYSVVATDSNGCANSASLSLVVSACAGLAQNRLAGGVDFLVYPNPAHGEFTIKGQTPREGTVTDILGQHVASVRLDASNNYTQQLSGFVKGVYFVNIDSRSLKLVVE